MDYINAFFYGGLLLLLLYKPYQLYFKRGQSMTDEQLLVAYTKLMQRRGRK